MFSKDEYIPDPKLIKQMRKVTCLPLLECRNWIIKCNGNLEEAIKLAKQHHAWRTLDDRIVPPPKFW